MQKTLLIFVSTIFLLTSCGSNEFSDPNVVAQKFLAHYVTLEYDEAEKYASTEFTPILDECKAGKALMDESSIAMHKTAVAEIKNIELQEKEGTAIVKFSNSETPDLVDELELKKVDDKWLIADLERKTDILTEEKFSEDFIDDLEKEAEEQDEIIPVE